MMDTVFDSPQWGWRRSYQQYDIHGLSNKVHVHYADGRDAAVLVSIPIPFVTYLREIHPKAALGEASLYLDQLSLTHWVFGYDLKEGESIYTCDLWTYRRPLPKWINPGVSSDPR